jgi:hypothetical protein
MSYRIQRLALPLRPSIFSSRRAVEVPASIRNSRLAKQGNAPNSGKFYILLPPAVVAMVVVARMEQTVSVAIGKLFIILGLSRLGSGGPAVCCEGVAV